MSESPENSKLLFTINKGYKHCFYIFLWFFHISFRIGLKRSNLLNQFRFTIRKLKNECWVLILSHPRKSLLNLKSDEVQTFFFFKFSNLAGFRIFYRGNQTLELLLENLLAPNQFLRSQLQRKILTI